MASVTSIRRLLIANRGEIVCRIARTARRMGIETVGIYSEPDANALHVDSVDIAVALGGATPAESYLRSDAVVQAALDSGCDAVHPGYGFLAENAGFARQVVDAGLVWVGPTPEQIELLGDKVAAKRVAMDAGVATAAVFEGAPDELPADLPLPVVVKAAAGGGGRGMRIVADRTALEAAMVSASREAASAFGDGRVFIEPYLEDARHVEVQIIGDTHGSVAHLGERECSIQRRSQKVIEEAPSAGITPATRAALHEGALALARAVEYTNAGTVEFLVAADQTISFLEVNTRLQVEHPVTEAVTGFDLVELQLRVAAGEPLPFNQDDVVVAGHAIEARLVAEDPATGWLPAVGTITGFSLDDAVRVDAGVSSGSVVSADYDSLLAKVIAHAPTREEAAGRLGRALRAAHLAGPATNRNALVAVMEEPDFLEAATTTRYFELHPEVVAAAGPAGDDRLALLVAAVVHRKEHNRSADRAWAFAPPGWRNLRTHGVRSTWTDPAANPEMVEEVWASSSEAAFLIGPWPTPDETGALGPDERRRIEVHVLNAAGDRLAIEVDGLRTLVRLAGTPESGVTTTGARGGLTWTVRPVFQVHAAEEAGSGPSSPLPGTVVAVHVAAGQQVAEGEVLMVVEAMKMEHKITAAGTAVVAEVRFSEGDRVDAGDLLVRLEPVPTDAA
jgi:propionyl-CoA carboxylase alpha chain